MFIFWYFIQRKNFFLEKEGSIILIKIVYIIYSNRCSRKYFLKFFIINKEMVKRGVWFKLYVLKI